MKFRLYCIFEAPQARMIHHALPSEGARVQAMKKNGLCAVFSEVSDVPRSYDVSKVMQYHQVIESFFEQVTVVPFRFETALDDTSDLELLLEERGDYYRQILRRLSGCVEMGMRTMVYGSTAASAADCESSGFPSSEASNPGKLYLWSRKIHYADESLMAETRDHVSEKFRTAFTGMFKEFKSEASRLEIQGNDPSAFLISLYFLVPKQLLMSFRQQFYSLASMDSSRLLLSGPWPPYNFVLPGDLQLK